MDTVLDFRIQRNPNFNRLAVVIEFVRKFGSKNWQKNFKIFFFKLRIASLQLFSLFGAINRYYEPSQAVRVVSCTYFSDALFFKIFFQKIQKFLCVIEAEPSPMTPQGFLWHVDNFQDLWKCIEVHACCMVGTGKYLGICSEDLGWKFFFERCLWMDAYSHGFLFFLLLLLLFFFVFFCFFCMQTISESSESVQNCMHCPWCTLECMQARKKRV